MNRAKQRRILTAVIFVVTLVMEMTGSATIPSIEYCLANLIGSYIIAWICRPPVGLFTDLFTVLSFGCLFGTGGSKPSTGGSSGVAESHTSYGREDERQQKADQQVRDNTKARDDLCRHTTNARNAKCGGYSIDYLNETNAANKARSKVRW